MFCSIFQSHIFAATVASEEKCCLFLLQVLMLNTQYTVCSTVQSCSKILPVHKETHLHWNLKHRNKS